MASGPLLASLQALSAYCAPSAALAAQTPSSGSGEGLGGEGPPSRSARAGPRPPRRAADPGPSRASSTAGEGFGNRRFPTAAAKQGESGLR